MEREKRNDLNTLTMLDSLNLYERIIGDREATNLLLNAGEIDKRAVWQLVKHNLALQKVCNEAFIIFLQRSDHMEMMENLGIFWTTAFLQGMKFQDFASEKLKTHKKEEYNNNTGPLTQGGDDSSEEKGESSQEVSEEGGGQAPLALSETPLQEGGDRQ